MGKDIISRLSENRLHMPDNFGSYKLFEGNNKPPLERTWWQKHYMAIAPSFVVVIVVGLLAFGAWLIWRRKRWILSYKPVDTIVTEQELQPL
ncbi:hypothetical protein CDL12_03245 [Handroanthus impetiginosus]|uniref:Uncharacterized protein n=1 Tax=Handroanthus impetiginosus TaxID=429701 RepID=A0A2G9I2P2_9LAMI|nr:hypothetical protein CDL12_03245 [Handroanthus impetiginosus]